MSQLVLTTPLMSTESLPGYLLRLTELNGYDTNLYLLREFAKTEGHSYFGVVSAQPLIALAGATPAEAARLSYQIEGRQSQRTINLLGREILTCDYRLNTPRVCPCCIDETGACEAFWDLAMVTACPVHKIALLDRCEVCAKTLRWGRGKIGECRCGAKLASQGSRSTVCQSTVDLMQAFRWALYRDDTRFPLPTSLKHLGALDLYGLCKLVWVLSGEIGKSLGVDRTRDRTRKLHIDCLDDSAKLLTNWPKNFQAYLNQSYRHLLNDPVRIPRFATLFDWALGRMDKNLRRKSREAQFFLDQIYLFGAEHWSRDKLLRGTERTKILPKNMKWGTIKEASAITGLQGGTLGKHIAAGEVPLRRMEGDRLRSVMVDLDWARARKRSKYAPIGVRNAARALGLTSELTRELRQLGVYEVTRHLHFPNSYSVEDVKMLKGRFARISGSKMKVVPKAAMKLSTALTFRITDPKRKALFLKQLLDGMTSVLGHVGKTPMDLVVARCDVDMFIKENSDVVENTLSREDAATRLNASRYVIQALIDKGYLKTISTNSGDKILVDSLIAFQERFTMLSQVAKRAGLPTDTIRSLAKKMKLKFMPLATEHNKGWMLPQSDLSRFDKYLTRQQ